jgi:hypothetical protein
VRDAEVDESIEVVVDGVAYRRIALPSNPERNGGWVDDPRASRRDIRIAIHRGRIIGERADVVADEVGPWPPKQRASLDGRDARRQQQIGQEPADHAGEDDDAEPEVRRPAEADCRADRDEVRDVEQRRLRDGEHTERRRLH